MDIVDWNRMTAQAGLLNIACIHEEQLPADMLKQSFADWSTVNRGALSYMDGGLDVRLSPFTQRPWAKSLLIVSFLPRVCPSPLANLPPAREGRPFGEIAPYALCEDYHLTGRTCLKKLEDMLHELAGETRCDYGVDTLPVPEKMLAEFCGIGSRGMNALMVDAVHGCRIHLGFLFTDLDLPVRLLPPPHACSQCGQCIAACPTHAMGPSHVLDVRRCRAWLSGEFRGPLSWEQQKLLGHTLFGCGRCTAACPKSSFQKPLYIDIQDFINLPSATVSAIIRQTPLAHAGTTILKRNAVAILGGALTSAERAVRQDALAKRIHSDTVLQTLYNWSHEDCQSQADVHPS